MRKVKRKTTEFIATYIPAIILIATICILFNIKNMEIVAIALLVAGFAAYTDSMMLGFLNIIMTIVMLPTLMLIVENYLNITSNLASVVSMGIVIIFLMYLPINLLISTWQD